MATRAVHSAKPAASAQPAAVKLELSPAEKTAQALCGIIANNQAQAVSTGDRATYGRMIASKAGEVSKLSNSGPWAKLAKELHTSATAYITSGKLPTLTGALPTTFTGPSQIETALKNAYQFTLLNQNSEGVRRCLEAAQKAIAALPTRNMQDQNNLNARLGLIKVLIAHKNKPQTKPAPQSCLVKAAIALKAAWAHPATKVALVAVAAVAANSVLHGFGVMPAWTRPLSAQGIYGLCTSGISGLIQSAGTNSVGSTIATQTLSETTFKVVEQSSYLSTIATIGAISVTALVLLGLGYYCVGKAVDATDLDLPDLYPAQPANAPAQPPQAHDAGHGHGAPAVVMERKNAHQANADDDQYETITMYGMEKRVLKSLRVSSQPAPQPMLPAPVSSSLPAPRLPADSHRPEFQYHADRF
ncbi:MAG TPA: hypothetical protein VLG44_07960 [Chlamydiales bacterium]|nr:hypothetical protein [Chlamydiales bacterium]